MSSLRLKWNAVAGATAYQVAVRPTGTAPYAQYGDPISVTTVLVDGLDPATSYDFAITASNDTGIGPVSTLTATTAGNLPTEVLNFAAGAITTSSITLVWDQPTSENGPYSYVLQYAQVIAPLAYQAVDSSIVVTATGGSTTISGLTAGIGYLFRVYAVNSAGNGPVVSPLEVWTLPALPAQVTQLTIIDITDTSVTIGWVSATNAVTYQPQFQQDGTSPWLDSGEPIGDLSATVDGLTPGINYNFRVFGISSTGASGPVSLIISTPTAGSAPVVVTNLYLSSPTTNSISLSWASAFAVPADVVYRVEYKLSSSATWTLAGVPVFARLTVVAGLQAGQNYDFRVTGINDIGVGPPSAVSSLGTLSPSTLTTWNAADLVNMVVSNGNRTVTGTTPAGSTVYGARSTTAFSSGRRYVEFTLTTAVASFAVGLADGGFDFVAASVAGLGSDAHGLGIYPASSPQSASAGGIRLVTGNLAVDSSGAIVSLALDFDAGVFWFTTDAMRAELGPTAWNENTAADPAAGVGGLPIGLAGGPYFLAFNAVSSSAPACTLNVGTSAFNITMPVGFTTVDGSGTPFIPPPSQPVGLISSGTQDILLSWSSGGGTVDYFQVSYRRTGSSLWFPGAVTTQTSASIGLLLPSVQYDFQVQAFNAAGAGPPSALLTITTPEATASILPFRGFSLAGSDPSNLPAAMVSFPHANTVVVPVYCSTADSFSTDVTLMTSIGAIGDWIDAANHAGMQVLISVAMQPRDGAPRQTITPGPSFDAVTAFFDNLRLLCVQIAQLGNAHGAAGMFCTELAPWAGFASGDTGPFSAPHCAQWQAIYQACKRVWPSGIIAYAASQTSLEMGSSGSAWTTGAWSFWSIWDAVGFTLFPGTTVLEPNAPAIDQYFDTQIDPDPQTQAATGSLPLFTAMVQYATNLGRALLLVQTGIVAADGNQLAPHLLNALPPPWDLLGQSAWWAAVVSQVTKHTTAIAGFVAYDAGDPMAINPYTGITNWYGLRGSPAAANIDSAYAGLMGMGGSGLTVPPNLAVTAVTDTTITVQWSALPGASITYTAEICFVDTEDYTQMPPTAGTSVTFIGLFPGTSYAICVAAHQGAAVGPMSVDLVATTTGETPKTVTVTVPAIVSTAPFVVTGTLEGFPTPPALSYVDDGAVAMVGPVTLTAASSSSLSLAWDPLPAAATVPFPPDAIVTATSFEFTHPSLSVGPHTIAVTTGTTTGETVCTVSVVASPDRTVVEAGSGQTITDNFGNVWGVTQGGQVSIDSTVDTGSVDVQQLAWVSELVWYGNSAGLWFAKPSISSAWTPPAGTVNPLGSGPLTITVTAPAGVVENAPFVLSGSLSGYTDAPQLTFADDGGPYTLLLPGTAGSTNFFFTRPGLPAGTHLTTIADVDNPNAYVSTMYPVTARGGAGALIVPPITNAAPGRWMNGTITANGITTTYRYLFPQDYDARNTYPLVLFLHPSTDPVQVQTDMDAWVNTAAWRSVYPSIVLAPILDPSDVMFHKYWGGVDTTICPSQANAVLLIQQFMANFAVAEGHVHCVGLAAGGTGAWDLAVKINSATGTQGRFLSSILTFNANLQTVGYPTPTATVASALAFMPTSSIRGGLASTSSQWERNLYAVYGGAPSYAGNEAPNGRMSLLIDPGQSDTVWQAYLSLPAGKPTWDRLFSEVASVEEVTT